MQKEDKIVKPEESLGDPFALDQGESKEDTQGEPEVTSENEPNIVFVGDGEPTTKIVNGMETYKLPKVDVQADVETVPAEKEGESETTVYKGKPFYHKNADQIVQLFPDMYKKFVKKGS
jgi:hypothetical protein